MQRLISEAVHRPFRLRALSAALAAASSAAPFAQAQPAAPTSAQQSPGKEKTDDTVLKTVKVQGAGGFDAPPETDGLKANYQRTATKMPLSVRETPQSVSVITRESLDARQVQTLGQALEMSAGVSQFSGNGPFAGQPSFGFNMTTIRGIEISDLYDFRDDGFVSGSYFSQPDLAIYDRVEVVKGPNSVLYGRGSVGGLINRVRKKPLPETRTELTATVGSYDTYRLDADVTGALNEAKTLRGRLVAAYQDAGSFVDGAETQRTVLAPSIEFDVTERTRLLVQGLYQDEDIIPNTGMPLRGTRFDDEGNVTRLDAPDISRRQFNGVPNRDPYTWRVQSVLAQLDHEFNDDWLVSLRFSKNKIDTPIDVDAYTYGFRNTGDDPSTPEIERVGDTNLIGSDYDIERDVWSGEIQLNGRFDIAGHEVKVAVGADHNDNEYSRRGIYYNVAGFSGPSTDYNLYDGNFARVDRSSPNVGTRFGGDPRSTGAYVQAQISATDRLKVLLGARYDTVELRSFNGATKDSETVSDTTGRVGLTYALNPNISLYGLYAQSFEPVLFSFDIDGKLLDPETGEIREIGAKTEWFDGRLALSTALYQIDREDVPASVPPLNNYSLPDGSQSADGFEIEINGRLLPGWDISLAYNNVDSEYRNPHIPAYNSGIAGSPEWQLGVYTSYEIQSGALRGLGVGLTRFEIAERGVSPTSRGMIPGYERYDAHVFYKGLKNIDINLTVRNVTDEVYVEGADRQGAYAQFGSPTAALLSVSYVID